MIFRENSLIVHVRIQSSSDFTRLKNMIIFLMLGYVMAESMTIPNNTIVVQLKVSGNQNSYVKPWNIGASFSVSGSGLLLDSNMHVLTNFHVVKLATRITVLYRDQQTYGRVVRGSRILDLALVELDTPLVYNYSSLSCIDNDSIATSTLFRDDIPKKDEQVIVQGFPVGSEDLSLTKGVVSRIIYNKLTLLHVQVDAAINAGNSGGPGFDSNGNVVGIVASKLASVSIDNIGFLISVPVLRLFLRRDFRDIHCLGVTLETMTNPWTRQLFGVEHGVRVSQILHAVENHTLQVNDIILKVAGHAISTKGKFHWRLDEMMSLYFLVQVTFQTSIEMQVKRKNDILDLNVTIPWYEQIFIPYEPNPRGIIVSGLVFAPISVMLQAGLLQNYGHDVSPAVYRETRMFPGHEMVVLVNVLTDSANSEIEFDSSSMVVKTVNDVSVKNLTHFHELVNECHDGFIRFGMEKHGLIVIHARNMSETNQRIANTYHCFNVY